MAIRISIQEKGLRQIQSALTRYAKRTEKAISDTVGKLAHELRKDIVTGIKSQAPGGIQFKSLAASTVAAKGSSKALIDHGDLLRSVNVTRLGNLNYFVGVHRSVTAPDGQSMVNIAEIHEFGSKKVKNRPPARPFLRPSYNAWRYGVEQRFAQMVARAIGVPMTGKMGTGFSTGDDSGVSFSGEGGGE